MQRNAFILKPLAAVVLLGCSLLAGDWAAAQELAITKADVQFSACRSYQGDAARPVDEGLLWNLLGLAPGGSGQRWDGAQKANDGQPTEFAYVLVLKKPAVIGSLFCRGASQAFYLKPGAPVTADLRRSKNWVPVEVPASQAGAALVPLPPGVATQAVMFVDERKDGVSSVEAIRLFKARWQNVVPASLAYASHEYYRPPADFVTPFLYAASHVTRGSETWYSSGKGKDGRVSTPPISDVHAEWFMLAWDEPHTVRSIWLHSNIQNWSLEQFAGDAAVNPRVGTEREWRRVKNFTEQPGAGRWIVLDQPLVTRGLRIHITKVYGLPQIAWVDGLHVLEDLGQEASRNLVRSGPAADRPPFEIPIELATADNLTLVVNDAQGHRVRNLVARVPAEAGRQTLGWDLKDEQHGYVPPGNYQWQAITCPTLQPRYEFTVYPNVNENAPENPAWFTGANGPGGWLADHCNNSAVCVVGDRVFLAAYMAESGVALIECNLAGHKRWGHPGFADWTGVGQLASDGTTLFNVAQINGPMTESIWGVDIESKQIRPLTTLKTTAQRQRGFKGIAARDGKLYLSVHAPDNWLANAVAVEDVDLTACYPLYPPARKSKANEPVPDQRNDFLRLCRLHETPPGSSAQGSLVYLQSMREAAQRQHIVLALRREVPIGSIVLPRPEGKDVRLQVSILKSDALFPPKPGDERAWINFPEQPAADWDVLPAPPGTRTRALRLTFTKGEVAQDDLLSTGGAEPQRDDSFELGKRDKQPAQLESFSSKHDRWQAQLEGLKILRRRFENLSRAATVRVNSGAVAADGSWDAQRDKPITPQEPGIYAHQWETAQKVRGLAIKEVEGKLTQIDVYTGPDDGPIDIASSEGWQNVAQYEQARRFYYHPNPSQNHDARYLDGYVDFGREFSTRAVRLRIVEAWADGGDRNLYGTRNDHGGQQLDPTRCRVYGLAAVGAVGGELPVDKKINERLEVFDSVSGKLDRELDLDQPGRMAFDARGELYAVSGNSVVKVNRAGGKHVIRQADLESPGDITFDAEGNLYVAEHGDFGYLVRVYDPTGKRLRTIGHPGPRQAGPWDPQQFGRIVDLDIDREGQLWVVEDEYWPKRVALWTTSGKFLREFLGNTPYGGGGVLDPWDKSRLLLGPLEFELDWKTGHSRLKNLTWTGAMPGELPIHIDDRTYVVTWLAGLSIPCGIVYRYEQDHLVMAAAMGHALYFDPLKSPELIAKLGGPQLDRMKFVWSDLNGNGAVDAEEVQLTPKPVQFRGLTMFQRDLSAQAGPISYQVKQFLPSGVPVYEERVGPQAFDTFGIRRLASGNYYRLGTDGLPEAGLTAKGDVLWTYPSEGAGGHALYSAKPWFSAQIVSQGGYVGHEAPGGPLGEFCVFNTNAGGWNVMTGDGLLVASVFRDMRDPLAKPWSMSEHQRGLLLQDMSLAQEHFQGYFCRSVEDGKYYAVAGHNHASVVEITGLDQAKRYSGRITVSSDDVGHAQQWDEQQEKANIFQRAPVVDCYRREKPPQIDGKLDDWPAPSATIGEKIQFYAGFDEANLYAAWLVADHGPFRNSGQQWDRLFKTGACVDLQIGVDASAPVDRPGPAVGDERLLLGYLHDQPTAVLYRPVIENKAQGKPWRVVSPVAQENFDDARPLADVRFAHLPDDGRGTGYIVEAAIPLASIGLVPADGLRLKFDWGVLRTGPDGHEVLERIYWANRATSITADAPSEARLHPELWGFLRFYDGKRPSSEDRFESAEATGKPALKDKELKGDIDDILESIDEK